MNDLVLFQKRSQFVATKLLSCNSWKRPIATFRKELFFELDVPLQLTSVSDRIPLEEMFNVTA